MSVIKKNVVQFRFFKLHFFSATWMIQCSPQDLVKASRYSSLKQKKSVDYNLLQLRACSREKNEITIP